MYLSKSVFFSNFISHSYPMSQFVFMTSVSYLGCSDFWGCVMFYSFQSWVCLFSLFLH